MNFGEIVTSRLVLRPPVEADFADMLALWSDAEVLRHIGRPGTREEICGAAAQICRPLGAVRLRLPDHP